MVLTFSFFLFLFICNTINVQTYKAVLPISLEMYLKRSQQWQLTKDLSLPLWSSAMQLSEVTSPTVWRTSTNFLPGEHPNFWISKGSLSISTSAWPSNPVYLGTELLRLKLSGESAFSGCEWLRERCNCCRYSWTSLVSLFLFHSNTHSLDVCCSFGRPSEVDSHGEE